MSRIFSSDMVASAGDMYISRTRSNQESGSLLLRVHFNWANYGLESIG